MTTFTPTAKWRLDTSETEDWIRKPLRKVLAEMNKTSITTMWDGAKFVQSRMVAVLAETGQTEASVTYGGHHVAVTCGGDRVAMVVNDGCCRSCEELGREEKVENLRAARSRVSKKGGK